MFYALMVLLVVAWQIMPAAAQTPFQWRSMSGTTIQAQLAPPSVFPDFNGTSSQLHLYLMNNADWPGAPGVDRVTTGPGAIVSAWSGGVYVSSNQTLYIWGGGHGDYAGNEVYGYNTVTGVMSRVTNPWPWMDQSYGTLFEQHGVYSADQAHTAPNFNQPRSNHTYNVLVPVPTYGGFCSMGLPATSPSDIIYPPTIFIFCFDVSSNTWTKRGQITGDYTLTRGAQAAADPRDPNVIWVHTTTYGAALHKCTAVTGQDFSCVRKSPYESVSYDWTSVMDNQGYMWYIGWDGFGPNIQRAQYDLTNSVQSGMQAVTTTGDKFIEGQKAPGLAYLPAANTIVGWSGGKDLYYLNLATLVWTKFTPTGGADPGSVTETGTFGRFRCDEAQKKCWVTNSISQDMHEFYWGDGSPPPPPPPVDPFSGIGPLQHDGPATPHQIAFFAQYHPVVPPQMYATMRYRPVGGAWVVGHNPHVIQPQNAEPTPSHGPVVENPVRGVAWTITGLQPGTAYEVELRHDLDIPGDDRFAHQNMVFTTASLPGVTGPPNRFITAGMTANDIRFALASSQPGDVWQINDGLYNVGGNPIQVDAVGTAANPVVIRGQSYNAIVQGTGLVFHLVYAQHVRFEDFTIMGSHQFNSGAPSNPFYGWSNATQVGIVIRGMRISGTDRCITGTQFESVMFYNNTCFGNATAWDFATTGTSAAWNLDGINLPGKGNVAFNNFIRFFGDCLAVSFGGHPDSQNRGIHFYGNEVADCHDDAIEFDYAMRNVNAYKNRFTNAMTCLSYDPLYGGPSQYAQNVCVNKGRQLFKATSQNTGYHVMNNTFIATNSLHTVNGNTSAEAMILNFCCGNEQEDYSVVNNIFYYAGTGKMVLIESPGNQHIDFGYNLWAPRDGIFTWQGTPQQSSLSAIQANGPTTTPVFTALTKRHEGDLVQVGSPFVSLPILGGDYLTQVTSAYNVTLQTSSPGKNSGLTIQGVTDGFSGSAPDRGAVISGQPVLRYGPGQWQ